MTENRLPGIGAQELSDKLLGAFDLPLMQDALLKLEATLHISRNAQTPQLHIALRIGQERMYVVRNLPTFLRALERGERIAFGKGFALEPSAMRFERPDLLILEVLGEIEAAQRPCEAQGYRAPQEGKFLPLPPQQAKRVLRLLMAKPFRLALGADIVDIENVEHLHLPMLFTLSGGMQGLHLLVQMPDDVVPLTDDCMFIYTGGRVGLLAQRQRVLLRTLRSHIRDGRINIRFSEKDTERMISELLPQLELTGRVRMEASLEQRLMRLPLIARVFLDREDASITARVLFCYGEHEIDPFAPRVGEKASGPLLMRDAVAERNVLDELSRAGFRVRAGKVYLPGTQQTLTFLFEGVQTLMNKAEVFCSDRFKRMRPRKPALSGKLTMRQGMLAFSMMDGEATMEELQALLEALRDRRRYFRLRNGTFLDLEGMDAWQEMAGSLAEAAAYQFVKEDGALVMANYRAAYFAQLLGQTDLPIELDDSVRAVTDAMQEQALNSPASLNATLRPYQLRGFAWLHALYRLRMGGILADDMGLGKTLQLIALLCWSHEEEGTQRSLVIAPTSLIYNWQAEIARFAPTLRVHVVEGGQTQRQRQWEELAASEDVDVIISSYPLIRRGIATCPSAWWHWTRRSRSRTRTPWRLWPSSNCARRRALP
ncbi:MAG TPA: SNF2 helicase associated domain-containing protein [Clostridia bacterium]|nr:SNF2 helicase associated domain-containing protein [Clostridia bacterium]